MLPQAILVVLHSKISLPKIDCRHHSMPRFYPHSDEPLWARCMLRSDFKPRSVTNGTNLGCWGAAI